MNRSLALVRRGGIALAIATQGACVIEAGPFYGPDAAIADDEIDASQNAPSIPRPLRPGNDTYVGLVTAVDTLRPSFEWTVSTTSSGTIQYELEYSTDPSFATESTTVQTAGTTHRPPTELDVSSAVPVGARYYWHVRACAEGVCSAYSETWRVNVGRSAEDIDGDGLADALVGAPRANPTGDDAGAFYVVANTPTEGFGINDGFAGDALGDELGFSVGYAGDVNADGFADVVVGVPGSAENDGAAHVWLGSPTGLVLRFDLVGSSDGDYFGEAVSSAGDVNGDGFSDVIVGATHASVSVALLDSGRAYVYLGGPGTTFEISADAVLDGEASGDGFGRAVASAGDVNGDGFGDVLVGAPHSAAGGVDAGRAYVYLGGAGPFDTQHDGTLTGTSPGGWFGQTLGSAGDVNGDGLSDLIVGALLSDLGGSSSGAANVYFGERDVTPFDDTPEGVLIGASGEALGSSVAAAGDVNGDGFADVVVGAMQNSAGGSLAGAVYVYLGADDDSFETTADGTLIGGTAGELFGIDVAGVGDLDGDRFDDIFVGATPFSGPSTGAVYYYRGGVGLAFDDTDDGDLLGVGAGDGFGVSIASK